MIKNYFFLSRLGFELGNKIKGFTIMECYTSKKDTLFLTIINQIEYTMEICVDHSIPFIQLHHSFNRKKRNSVEIFPDILNLKISDVFIAKNDRVLLFLIENEISLFFAIRGKFTNIYLLNGTKFLSFKKISNEDLEIIKNEFLTLEFISPLTLPDFSDDDSSLSIYELKKKYPFISNEIINNIEDSNESPLDKIITEVKKIYYNDFYLINDFENKSYVISYSDPNANNKFQVYKYSSALEVSSKYIQMQKYLNDFSRIFSMTKKYIEKELIYLNNKKKNILTRLDSGSKESEFRKFAELLLINKSMISIGLSEIIVDDVFDNNNPISIQLNMKFTPQQNIEYYFKKAKDEKMFFDRSYKLLSDIDKKFNLLKEAEEELVNCHSFESVLSIMNKIGLKMKNGYVKQDEPKIKFRQYIIENKYNVFVGKDSKSNDLLTLKFAKQNDYWFHARSVSGSHVVLRLENKTEIIPKSILKKVARIAAFYSKAKSSSLVSVSYTQKKYVVKKKGMDIGQVALLKENTLLVKPEIPEDAVLVE